MKTRALVINVTAIVLASPTTAWARFVIGLVS